MLSKDPAKRPSAAECLEQAWFKEKFNAFDDINNSESTDRAGEEVSVGNMSPNVRWSDQKKSEEILMLGFQGSTISLLDVAANNLTKRKILKDTGKLCHSLTLPVTDMLKELTRDGIDQKLLENVIALYN